MEQAALSSGAHVYSPNWGPPNFTSSPPLEHRTRHGGNTPAQPRQEPLSPVIHNSTNWRQPVDGEGCVCLPDDHGWDGNGGGLSALTPLLIYKVQIAMHSGHLVRREAVGAVIICGDKSRNRRVGAFNLPSAPRQGHILLFAPEPPAPYTALVRLHKHLANGQMYSVPENISV